MTGPATQMISLQTAPREEAELVAFNRGILYRLALQLQIFPDEAAEHAFLGAEKQQQAQAVSAALKSMDAGGSAAPTFAAPGQNQGVPSMPMVQPPPNAAPMQQPSMPQPAYQTAPMGQPMVAAPPMPAVQPPPQPAMPMAQPAMQQQPVMQGMPPMPGMPVANPNGAPMGMPPMPGMPGMPNMPAVQAPPAAQAPMSTAAPTVAVRQPQSASDPTNAGGAPPVAQPQPGMPSMPAMPQPGGAAHAPGGDVIRQILAKNGELLQAFQNASTKNQEWSAELHEGVQTIALSLEVLLRTQIYVACQALGIAPAMLAKLVKVEEIDVDTYLDQFTEEDAGN